MACRGIRRYEACIMINKSTYLMTRLISTTRLISMACHDVRRYEACHDRRRYVYNDLHSLLEACRYSYEACHDLRRYEACRGICRSARPYESCKKFKGWPLQDAPSKLVQLWYKTFPPGRFLPGGNEEANSVE